ncbi:hypothetical protein MLD38_024371 [Melastoma candidum]|uniref:Uncharacterized protein n=1 Tax=Melastoma candidum TaxID=119954 RepID=A0ACB9NV31_9MYRT|nr:hypothetical protein MLD38_024371 [Melastoma candidum]
MMATASILRSLLAFMSVAFFSRALYTRAHIVPALYVFGDSFVDAGNNNFLNTFAKTNFTPYGIDLYGKLPLGRATNGLTYADFIGIIVSLVLLPFLVLKGMKTKFPFSRKRSCKRSIWGKKHDIASYTKLLVHSLAAKVERMAKLGAKKFVVRGMPLINCRSPFYKEIEQQCKELGKEIIPSYNAHLVKSLDRLTAKHGILYTIIVPEKVEINAVGMEIGSKFIDEPCCKINEFGGCIKDSEPCKDRDDYVYFDAGHPTQVYHKFVADHCFDGNSGTCKPYSILELSAK